jgi:prenyl protein peptidase
VEQVFGAFATLLLLRTGTLLAPVVAHTFCNWQGFPNFPRMLAHSSVVRCALLGGVVAFGTGLITFCRLSTWQMR